MAERILPWPARLIPNYAMVAPWTAPQTPEELDGLAATALLSGAADTNRAITTLLANFAGDYVVRLRQASG